MIKTYTKLVLIRSCIVLFVGMMLSVTDPLMAQRRCGAEAAKAQFHALYPNEQWHEVQYNNEGYSPAKSSTTGSQIVIPVVVHVIHDGNSATPDSITEAQVRSQLDVLFEDYRRVPGTLAMGGFGVDMGVEFSLATLDPQGRATTGINYYKDTLLADLETTRPFREDSVMYQRYVWNTNRYLNVWIVKSIDLIAKPRPSEQVLGYTYTPGVTSVRGIVPGVVMRYDVFGREGVVGGTTGAFNLGRTCTHEFGHWLGGLLHPFEGGCGTRFCTTTGDRVCDTPPMDKQTIGMGLDRLAIPCPDQVPDRSIVRPVNPRNFMDYTDDAGMNTFTPNQKDALYRLFNSDAMRKALASDTNLRTVGAGKYGAVKANFAANVRNGCVNAPITFTDYSMGQPDTFLWSFPGATVTTATTPNPTVTYANAGTYDVTLTVKNASGRSHTITKTGYITITDNVASLPFNENFTATNFPPVGWHVHNPDSANRTLGYGWGRSNAGATAAGSARIALFRYADYWQKDGLITPVLNLSAASEPQLSYRVAYAPLDTLGYTYRDTLRIYASTDCGATWQLLRTQGGEGLSATNAAIKNELTGSDAASWRYETLSLSTLKGQAGVRLMFETTSGFGNNLLLDDVQVTATPTARPAPTAALTQFTISPNPAYESITLQFNSQQTAVYSLQLTDMLGRTVLTQELSSPAGTQRHTLNVAGLTPGVYAVVLSTEGSKLSQRLVITGK